MLWSSGFFSMARSNFHRNGFKHFARLGCDFTERFSDHDSSFPCFGSGNLSLFGGGLDPLDEIGQFFDKIFPKLFQVLGVLDLLGHAVGQLAERAPVRLDVRLQFF